MRPEGDGAVLAFLVTLSRAAGGSLSVDYATSDGTAQAGTDYTAKSGTLTFGTGQTSQTIEVAVLDDAHDEGEETLTLTLSNPSGAVLTNATATGTIENHDAMPAALIARFGRTAAVHIVEQVEERISAPRQPGVDARVAGRRIGNGNELQAAVGILQQLSGTGYGSRQPGMNPQQTNRAPGNAVGLETSQPQGGLGTNGSAQHGMQRNALRPARPGMHNRMGMRTDMLLRGSGFALNRETRNGGVLSFWSRQAQSQFHGTEGLINLNGDVRTSMFGADYSKGRLMTGVSLAHSRGAGSYAGVDNGQLTSAVTGLYPWVGYKVSERVTVWGLTGYGAGGMLLSPGGNTPIETSLSMAMGAAGTRGELVDGGAGGFDLAFKADALWVGTSIAGTTGPGGNLADASATVTRLRTGIETSRRLRWAGRVSVTPSIELGIRQDGGDAENGAGIDVGAGLVMQDGKSGLRIDLRVRTLLVHQAEGFSERGVSVAVSYNPTPSTPLGLSARVTPAWGGNAASGAEALWSQDALGGMNPAAPRHVGRQAVRRRARLRPAGRRPARRHAPRRAPHLGARTRLPRRLRDAGARAGQAEPAARNRRRAAREPGVPSAGRVGRDRPARHRARDRAVVAGDDRNQANLPNDRASNAPGPGPTQPQRVAGAPVHSPLPKPAQDLVDAMRRVSNSRAEEKRDTGTTQTWD